jgi:hypothetical protein
MTEKENLRTIVERKLVMELSKFGMIAKTVSESTNDYAY